MLDHPTLDQLKTLRLDGMAEAFAEMQSQDGTADLTHAEWLGLLVDRESVNAGLKLLHSPERKYLSLTGIGLSIDPHSGVPPNSDAVVRGCGQTGGRCLGFRLCLTVGCV